MINKNSVIASIKSFFTNPLTRVFAILIIFSCILYYTPSRGLKTDNNIVSEPVKIKADLSSSKNFLSCIRVQRKCIYDSISEGKEKMIIQSCGAIDYCDQKNYSSN